ncbi:MAG: HAMP domain-containing histidine kinase [Phycisphaerae bacterium]|nr:HAMP domain-containing histidine kinase [Phycisphaerae bacterium]
MTSPRTARRHAVTAIAVVSLLVVAGLGWATHLAIQLDRVEELASRERSLDEARAIALSRLDGLVAPVLDREQGRPYEHFRPYYKPAHALNEKDGAEVSGSILLESPLLTMRGPDWLLLHFQATETDESESWSSPQIEEESRFATPASVIPAADRPRQALAENWLAAIRERYTPLELLQELEHVVTARGDAMGRGAPATGSGMSEPPSRDTSASNGIRHGAAEFLRRGARLVQLESEDRPIVCWPETVAFENLEAPVPAPLDTTTTSERSPICVSVLPSPMKPVWLDVTLDGRKQLAFMRTVTVETGNFCTLQGVLIDWPRLQDVLETEVRKLFPQARITPVATDVPVEHGLTHTMMQTIPARLEMGESATAEMPGISTGLKAGLAVAWGATIMALFAIGYGTVKYATDAERRMRFASAVTHELRTPLTSFQLYSDLLADMPVEDARQRRHFAETLRGESKRLSRLVENVLAYSRIGAAEPALHLRKTAPQDLLDAVHCSATGEHCRAAGKDLVVENRCSNGLAIETDSEFVVQILTNLVENACKYSADADDRRVWLTASEGPIGMVTFEVDDAGSGVRPHDRRAVFQPFRRSNPAGSKGAGGVGLGLALSRYWATCLGGHLTLRRSPRNGTRYSSFVLSLPIGTQA